MLVPIEAARQRGNSLMIRLPALLLLTCALWCAGCSDPRERAHGQLRKGGAERLRHDAALLYKDLFSRSNGRDFTEIWYKEWPSSFKQCAPLHVGAYLDGFCIAMQGAGRFESGLFIVPQSMDHEPKPTHHARFERLSDGVYWYSFGD
ncbi:MAG: hypothetical protein QOE70_4106 [Chthoniobacter sp.]|nr:hypothetical protein [Chthoniobacter sp.]